MNDEDRVPPVGLFNYAHSYASSAAALQQTSIDATHSEAPIRFLYTHAIELYLKSYLRLNGVTVKDLRSYDLGHNMKALREKAQDFGLSLNVEQKGQIDLLSNAILDKYFTIGKQQVLPLETLHGLCVVLHNQFGEPIYKDRGLTRAPIPLK